MRLMRALSRGFTLIELLMVVAIFAFLSLLAVPMYGEFLANTQVRTAAESVLSGVRLAQAEAVRRNVPVRFAMVGTTGWRVDFHTDELRKSDCGVATSAECTADNRIVGSPAECDADSQCTIKQSNFTEGADKATVTLTGGTAVTFSSLGLPLAANLIGTPAPLTMVAVSTSATSDPRVLNVIIGGTTSSTGGTKLCDPKFASTDPLGCPS